MPLYLLQSEILQLESPVRMRSCVLPYSILMSIVPVKDSGLSNLMSLRRCYTVHIQRNELEDTEFSNDR